MSAAEFLANGQAPNAQNLEESLTLYNAGLGVLRSPGYFSQTPENRHALYTVGERAEANNGGGHEQEDLGSFIITAGKHQMIIDPGYLGYDNREQTNKAEHHNSIMVRDHFLGVPAGGYKGASKTDWGNLSQP